MLDRYADARLPEDDDQGEGQLDFGGADISVVAQRSARRALGVDALLVPLRESLESRGLLDLNADIEVPLVRVLAQMEILGVGVDEPELRRLRDSLVARCDELRALIWTEAGERQAMNAGIQGLAADIFKVALIRLDQALDAAGSTSRLILQVHDEVICEVPPADLDAVTAIVLEAMSGAFDLRVPLEVHLSHGDSWAAAKG